LVVAYISGSIGVFSTFYLGVHRYSFQEFVVESIPPDTEDLFFSEIDFKKIEWIEDGREFELSGKLYDVSKIEKTANGFHIYCVNDSLEENFIAMFDQWKKSNSPSSKIKTIFQPQFCNRIGFEYSDRLENIQIEFSFDPHTYTAPINSIPSPPPKFHS